MFILMQTKSSLLLSLFVIQAHSWDDSDSCNLQLLTAIKVFCRFVLKSIVQCVDSFFHTRMHSCVLLTLSPSYSEQRIPVEDPGPLTNARPCQRQRGFKTGGFGRLFQLQAIFQPIHLARIIECPCLSMPAGVTSYHKPPVPLLIKQGMWGSS